MISTYPENRIYHYCKLSTAIELILKDQRLLLSPIINTNDPRENKSFVFAANSLKIMDIGAMTNRNKEISEILRKDCKLISFSQDDKHLYGFESSRMWSYYGGNHQGVCLELDKKKFLEENEIIINPTLFKKI